MSQNTLQQFARQLHAWAADELQKKPGPFRTVDAFPTLLGETGNIAPPVVFWINRESHLAGGVILLPKKDPADVLEAGIEICAALGLDTYYTWGMGEVAAWRVNSTPSRQWTEPLPKATMQEANAFREVLSLLLQNMQNLFFSRQQHLPRLSAPYLTNLLYRCIDSAMPTTFSASTMAGADIDKNKKVMHGTLTNVILQILSLYSQDSLPTRSNPDHLLIDLKRECARLPPSLATALSQEKGSEHLSAPAIIKLHHLYQKLLQIGPDLSTYIPETLKRLLHYWAETYDLSPLPAPLMKNRSTLIINPDRYHPEMSVTIEIAKPPLTAATALLRFLQSPDRRHPSQLPDLLDLREPVTVDAVIGTLDDRSRATTTEQQQMNALLRHSWPNRHLKLASTAPQWSWRMIHLSGLLRGTRHGILDLPADWLWASYGKQIFALISERLTIIRISATNSNLMQIEFKQTSANRQIKVDALDNNVHLLDNQSSELSRAAILLALSLPTTIFDLIRNGELKPATNENMNIDAVELFLRSSLGRGLWQILAPKKQLPKKEKLIAEVLRTGLPLPGGKTLAALANLTRKQKQLDTPSIDRELEVWLGSACLSVPRPYFRPTVAAATATPENNPAKEIADDLIRSGELRSFPQDYLYDIPENARQTFSITGPLHIGETFFNTVTLSLEEGTMQVEGITTARALQLISTIQVGRVELPADAQQMETILDRYLRDLQALYDRLQQESAYPNLADQIWKHLVVPPRDTLDSH